MVIHGGVLRCVCVSWMGSAWCAAATCPKQIDAKHMQELMSSCPVDMFLEYLVSSVLFYLFLSSHLSGHHMCAIFDPFLFDLNLPKYLSYYMYLYNATFYTYIPI